MAFMVNVPQGPDIWSGYHRSLENIGQGIGTGVTSYFAERRKKRETEKARERLQYILTSQGLPSADVPADLDKASYDAMTISAMNRRLMKPWAEEERQQKITDERSMLDYRSELDKKRADYQSELEDKQYKGRASFQSELEDKQKQKTISDAYQGYLGTKRPEIYDESGEQIASPAPIAGIPSGLTPEIYGKLSEVELVRQGKLPGEKGKFSITSGHLLNESTGSVSSIPGWKPEVKYKDREIVLKNGNWQKQYTTDDGANWQDVGESYKKSASDTGEDDYRSWIGQLNTLNSKKASIQSEAQYSDPEDAALAMQIVQDQIDEAERYIKTRYPEQWHARKGDPVSSALPPASNNKGKTVAFNGKKWYSNGRSWIDIQPGDIIPPGKETAVMQPSQQQGGLWQYYAGAKQPITDIPATPQPVMPESKGGAMPNPPERKDVPPKMLKQEGTAFEMMGKGVRDLSKRVEGNIMGDQDIASADINKVKERMKYLENSLLPYYLDRSVEYSKLKKRLGELGKLPATREERSPMNYPAGAPSLFPWEGK